MNSVCVCVCVSTAPGVCVCVCVCPLLQVCVCVPTAPGVCVCVCAHCSRCVCVCVCAHCSRCVCVCVPTAPGVCVCVCVSTAPSVCALGWVKCREHISLLVILCIIVHVTNNIYIFFFKPISDYGKMFKYRGNISVNRYIGRSLLASVVWQSMGQSQASRFSSKIS